MQEQILNNSPKPRCYDCGTTEIKYVCHNCGNLMCDRHSFTANSNRSKKLLASEFARQPSSSYYCSKCINLASYSICEKIEIFFSFLALLFMVIVLYFIRNKLELNILFSSCLGLGLLGYGIYAFIEQKKQQEKQQEIRKNKPYITVIPNFSKFEIEEKIKGFINLNDDGIYQVKEISQQGKIDIFMNFNWEEYQKDVKYNYKKYKYLPEEFHAGFAVLNGSAGINFITEVLRNKFATQPDDTVIELIGDAESQLLLNENDNDESNIKYKNNFCFKYDLLDKIDKNSFPIQLVLSFIPETNMRGIEIKIQWDNSEIKTIDRKSHYPKLQISEIKLLEVEIHPSWGRVKPINPKDYISPRQNYQTITWKNVPIEDKKEECCSVFKFQLEDEMLIKNNLSNDIKGRIEVIFQNTSSGIENIMFYYPVGTPNTSFDKNKSTVETEVTADFELSLAKLRYQYTKKLPDNNTSRSNMTFLGVKLTYDAIMLLTNFLSREDNGFYVEQIIETPISIDSGINQLTRSWYIRGRWYENVYPINFSIKFTAREENDKSKGKASRITNVEFSVEGNFSNDEMEGKIERQWEILGTLMKNIFQKFPEQSESNQLGA
jgi:hypothetical protein